MMSVIDSIYSGSCLHIMANELIISLNYNKLTKLAVKYWIVSEVNVKKIIET